MTRDDQLAELLNRPPDRVKESADGKHVFIGWKSPFSEFYKICKVENYKDMAAGMVRKWADGNYTNYKELWVDVETKTYEEI